MCFFMHSIRNENMLKMFTVLYFHLFIDSLSCSFSILFFEFRLVIAFCKMYNSFSVEGLYSFIFLGQVISYLNYTFDSLMNALSDSSNGVILEDSLQSILSLMKFSSVNYICMKIRSFLNISPQLSQECIFSLFFLGV